MSANVYFKGKEYEIEEVRFLFAQINDIYEGARSSKISRCDILFKYLNDNSDKNKMLNAFLSNYYECFFGFDIHYFAMYDLTFDQSEKTLGILEHFSDVFLIEEWIDLLIKTFPNISFFFVGEYYWTERIGMNYYIYEEGKYVEYEEHFYDTSYGSGDYGDEFLRCVEKLVRAEISVWKLSGGNEQLLKDAEVTAKAARQEYEIIIKQIEEERE